MPAAVISTTGQETTNSSLTFTLNVPAHNAGDLLCVFTTSRTTTESFTLSGLGGGWSTLSDPTSIWNTVSRSGFWYKVASAASAAATVTMTISGSTPTISTGVVAVIRGGVPANATFTPYKGAAGGSQTGRLAGITVPSQGLVFGCFGWGSSWTGSQNPSFLNWSDTDATHRGGNEVNWNETNVNTASSTMWTPDVPSGTSKTLQMDMSVVVTDRQSVQIFVPDAAGGLSPFIGADTTEAAFGGKRVQYDPTWTGNSGSVTYGAWSQISGTTAPYLRATAGASLLAILPFDGSTCVFRTTATDAAGRTATVTKTYTSTLRQNQTWGSSTTIPAGFTAVGGTNLAAILGDVYDTASYLQGVGTIQLTGTTALPTSVRTTGMAVTIATDSTANITASFVDSAAVEAGATTVNANGSGGVITIEIPASAFTGRSLASGWKLKLVVA